MIYVVYCPGCKEVHELDLGNLTKVGTDELTMFCAAENEGLSKEKFITQTVRRIGSVVRGATFVEF